MYIGFSHLYLGLYLGVYPGRTAGNPNICPSSRLERRFS